MEEIGKKLEKAQKSGDQAAMDKRWGCCRRTTDDGAKAIGKCRLNCHCEKRSDVAIKKFVYIEMLDCGASCRASFQK